ncbi:NUDIX domain-containing protein [Pochonia chlamydosporia 170]|uniref:NUDIX domain-containing protein n=1 Tax=Pochonia chlamydosporia 170 TaxID=1380566 RepID=A0A179F0P7_METCM|nr:NUDIX domain-containing protein [Pochonia chlamydosporia 170]OAQ59024.2 NUDIX domain-containing protein [Pochonia chlamydosporia 170]
MNRSKAPSTAAAASAPAQADDRPRVGTCVITLNEDGKVLLLKRKGSHGDGTWGTPGSLIDSGEDHLASAVREMKKATGLIVANAKLLDATHDVFVSSPDKKEYISLWITATMTDPKAKPIIMEPDNYTAMAWKSKREIIGMYRTNPNDLFLPLRHLIGQRANCRMYVLLSILRLYGLSKVITFEANYRHATWWFEGIDYAFAEKSLLRVLHCRTQPHFVIRLAT